ncbi:MAG: DUF1330 domain-containing protein [Hyphomicrobiaceae bacterium]|nr:DUF1330 domain-containing protein [Hyphomicrobiaceae bacterium]
MPKGYVIVRATVTNPEQWAKYGAMTKTALDKFGGTPVVRGGQCETIEGVGAPRNVVLEFPSYEAALGYARSPEYAEAKNQREGAGVLDMVVVEGV